jgi:hypothetical protein
MSILGDDPDREIFPKVKDLFEIQARIGCFDMLRDDIRAASTTYHPNGTVDYSSRRAEHIINAFLYNLHFKNPNSVEDITHGLLDNALLFFKPRWSHGLPIEYKITNTGKAHPITQMINGRIEQIVYTEYDLYSNTTNACGLYIYRKPIAEILGTFEDRDKDWKVELDKLLNK